MSQDDSESVNTCGSQATSSSCSSVQPKRKASKEKKRGLPFYENETLHLLAIWATPETQLDFKRKKHALVYQEITNLHNKNQNYTRNKEEIQNKIKNLKSEYRKMKPKSGAAPPDWPFYTIINQVLGQRDSDRDDILDDSLSTQFSQAQEDDYDEEDHDDENDFADENISENGRSVASSTSAANVTGFKLKKIKRQSHKKQMDDKLIEKLLESDEESKKILKEMAEERKKESTRDQEIMQQTSKLLGLMTAYVENTMKEKNYPLPNLTFQNMQNSDSLGSSFNEPNWSNSHQDSDNTFFNNPEPYDDSFTEPDPTFFNETFMANNQFLSPKRRKVIENSPKRSALQIIDENTFEKSAAITEVQRSPKKIFCAGQDKENISSLNSNLEADKPRKKKFVLKTLSNISFPGKVTILPKDQQPPASNSNNFSNGERKCFVEDDINEKSAESPSDSFTSLLDQSDTESEKNYDNEETGDQEPRSGNLCDSRINETAEVWRPW